MRVLVACEFSGIVTRAFRELGHDAYSCDLLPTELPELVPYHIQDDVTNYLNDGWDMMIAFPPCTHLSISGARHFIHKKREQEEALEFVQTLLDAPIHYIALENPTSVISTYIREPNQYVHPYQFGHDASKKTYLWLKNLPLLVRHPRSQWISPRIVTIDGKSQKRWGNQTDSGQNKVTNVTSRALKRSRTFTGIASAMASQWHMMPLIEPEDVQPWFTSMTER